MKSVGFKLTAIMLSIVFIGITVTAGISLYITANVITKETIAKTVFRTQGEAYLINSWITSQQESMNTLSDVVAQMDNADLVVSNILKCTKYRDYGIISNEVMLHGKNSDSFDNGATARTGKIL